MPLVCRICARVNPAEAHYCYHDGAALDGHGETSGPLAIGAQRFHNPFIFPSGKSSRSFDELVLTCESNWSEAQEVLQQGYLEGFLGGLGRADLARAARHASQATDADLGLEEFLSKLPASTRQPPQLHVKPLEVNLGEVTRDHDQRLVLDLANVGMGLLSGSISCAECDWLSVGEEAASSRKLFQLRTELSLPIRVVGKCLRAGNKRLEGRLNLETNGGEATVVIRAEVPVIPFPDGVLAGARTPREIASKAKAAPKEAAPLFEKGAVAAWYERNGWTYPVQGPPASGLGAIQQFFEALGLVKPPTVTISKESISFTGDVGAGLEEEIKVQTVEKRPVFAHAISSAPWLKIGKVSLEGRTARIAVSVPAIPAQPGERLQAAVHVTANGNQRFSVDVTLYVTGQAKTQVLHEAGWGYLPSPLVPNVNELLAPIEIPFAEVGSNVPPAAIPLYPSLADLHGTDAPVARVVQLPEEPVMVRPLDIETLPPQRRPPGPVMQPDRDDATNLTARARPLAATRNNGIVETVVASDATDDETGPRRTSFWVHLLPLAILLLCLLVTFGRDLTRLATARSSGDGDEYVADFKLTDKSLAALRAEKVPEAVLTKLTALKDKEFQREPFVAELARVLDKVELERFQNLVLKHAENIDSTPRIALHFHDQEKRIHLGKGGVKPEGDGDGRDARPAFWEPSMRFGLVVPGQPDPNRRGSPKRLTFEAEGLTNNTVVKLDGAEWIFGDRPFRELNGRYLDEWPGRWLGKYDEYLPPKNHEGEGHRSVWYYDEQKVEITQIVRIVRGSQTNLLDTCEVRYRIQNKDHRGHSVGLRFMLDTFIGSNDGVPFLLPGASALCDTEMDFTETARIPDFIQARETSDLSHPGTIAQVGLKLAGLDPPSRVTLGAWPNPRLENRDERCLQEKTMWEVPVLKIHTLHPGDSAVTIYWNPRELGPNMVREVGFTYGLGRGSGGEGAGKLALAVGGSFLPRGEFTVTALVNNPAPGQTVTLKLPEGFDLLDGSATQPVPPLPSGAVSRNSPVTWKVRGSRQEGTYSLKVDSSTGVSQTQPVTIKLRGIFGG